MDLAPLHRDRCVRRHSHPTDRVRIGLRHRENRTVCFSVEHPHPSPYVHIAFLRWPTRYANVTEVNATAVCARWQFCDGGDISRHVLRPRKPHNNDACRSLPKLLTVDGRAQGPGQLGALTIIRGQLHSQSEGGGTTGLCPSSSCNLKKT